MMNSKKTLNLNLNNFQSISKAHLEFQEGINLIIGSSNSGKTATIRALKALLLNPSGSQRYIKHETDNSSVLLEYNGNLVEWRRTKKESKYSINGNEYSKVGNQDLFELLDSTGFAVDEKDNVTNIEGEWDTLFPFDKSGAELFKLFENVFCVADSAKILSLYKQEESEFNRELNECTTTINKNKVKLEAISKFQKQTDVDNLKFMKESLTGLYNQYSDVSRDVTELNRLVTFLKVIPDHTEVKTFTLDSLNEYSSIQQDIEAVNEIKRYIKCLRGTDTHIRMFNQDLTSEYIKIKHDINMLEKLSQYPDITDEETNLFNQDILNKYLSINTDINALVSIKKDMHNLKKQSLDVDEELKIAKEELSKYSTCPTCGSLLSECSDHK